jgi:hypothetical protein
MFQMMVTKEGNRKVKAARAMRAKGVGYRKIERRAVG